MGRVAAVGTRDVCLDERVERRDAEREDAELVTSLREGAARGGGGARRLHRRLHGCVERGHAVDVGGGRGLALDRGGDDEGVLRGCARQRLDERAASDERDDLRRGARVRPGLGGHRRRGWDPSDGTHGPRQGRQQQVALERDDDRRGRQLRDVGLLLPAHFGVPFGSVDAPTRVARPLCISERSSPKRQSGHTRYALAALFQGFPAASPPIRERARVRAPFHGPHPACFEHHTGERPSARLERHEGRLQDTVSAEPEPFPPVIHRRRLSWIGGINLGRRAPGDAATAPLGALAPPHVARTAAAPAAPARDARSRA